MAGAARPAARGPRPAARSPQPAHNAPDVPTEIVDKLAAAMEKAMTSEAGRAYQATQPTLSLMMGPKELGEFQLREYQRFKRVADAAGIKPE